MPVPRSCLWQSTHKNKLQQPIIVPHVMIKNHAQVNSQYVEYRKTCYCVPSPCLQTHMLKYS